MRRIVLAAVGVLLLMVGLAEWQLCVLRADYQEGKVSGEVSVRPVALYLPFRQLFFSSSGGRIATAFHVARQPEAQDFVSSMRQAGLGFGMLRGVFLDPRAQMKWKNEAALEALTILVRMPWDEALSKEAFVLSAHLRNTLLHDASATLDEVRMIEDLLDLVTVRQGSGLVVGVHLNTVPTDERGAWRMGLQAVRLGLASCLNKAEQPLDAAWGALQSGFGQNWLYREWIAGWDSGLLQTVRTTRASADCQRLAARVLSMAVVAARSPQ